SSGGDLMDWDGWVKVLSKSYRVVRFDLPAFGLTGPVPSGNYSIDRYLTMVDALMDHLGIERFAIGGTSYGGLVAFRYAGTRTDRVSALILQNSAGIEYGGRGGTTERPREAAVFKPKTTTTEELTSLFKTIINDHSKITPEMIQRKADYWNIVGRDREAFLGRQLYERGNPVRVLGRVRAPALVLWGGSSNALSAETAQQFADALKNAKSVQKIIYEGGGHLMHIERPEETVRDVKAFLDREFRNSVEKR
ncbi:MAG TPA: alpha/beta hydrolase, partial [Steroidobacter sp.]|uniref:alpha/beta fold hydrolase n=1 Tax=Steroidobacter sp. TaxID=1978227 RepID=UPI002EDAEF60